MRGNPKLLIRTWEDERDNEGDFRGRILAFIGMIAFCLVFWFLVILASCQMAHADTILIKQDNIAGYSLNQWCEAIRHAEGVHSKHPYGILSKYKHTTPLQACRNTILHYWRDYAKLPLKTRQSKRFLDYAQERYCPIGAKNDPLGLNHNWSKNVEYYLKGA